MNTAKSLKKGISAVLIGRDEAVNLRKSLPPLTKCVDEIIFVDTGSQDDTVSIAREYGCSTVFIPWENDFSRPKNRGIERAGHEWILNVDCDEELQDPQRAREMIRQVWAGADNPKQPGWVPACIIWIDNLMADGTIAPSRAMRLFRNHDNIRFDNPVHEGVAESVYRNWPNRPPPLLEVRLLHHGYRGDGNRDKIKRNVAILRQWVERSPGNVYACYKLGTNLRHLGSHSEGLYFLQRAYAGLAQTPDKGSYAFLPELVTIYCRALMEAGRRADAQQVIKDMKGW